MNQHNVQRRTNETVDFVKTINHSSMTKHYILLTPPGNTECAAVLAQRPKTQSHVRNGPNNWEGSADMA